MIRIKGHPIRHRNRIREMRNRFILSGEKVEVIYENMNHILIQHIDESDKEKSREA